MKIYIKSFRIIDFFTKGHERSIKAKKNIIKMILVKGISVFIGLMFVPLFLNCLDTLHYGVWVTIFTLVSWIGFFDIGIGQGLRNKLGESLAQNDFSSARAFVSTAYISVGIIFLLLIGLFLIISKFVNWSFLVNPPFYLKNESNQLIIVVVCIMCINFIFRIFNSVVYAVQMPAISSFIELSSQCISLMFVYLASKINSINYLIIFGLIMTIVPTVVSFGFSLFYFRTKFKYISPSYKYFEKSKIKTIMMLGGSFFIIQIAFIALTQTNNVIIANVAGPSEVAAYNVVFRYMSILLMGFTIITAPLWSATTEAYLKNEIDWIKRTVKALLIISGCFVFIGIIMIIFSNFAFKIWIHNRIPINFLVMILTFIYIIIQMIWSIFGSVINGIGKIRFQLISTIIGACVHIPLAIILGNKMGAVGVILSLVIVSSSYLLWAPYQYKKLLDGTAKGIWNI
jgi:O-antigen/teichoic acid export membrane protein